jgi:CRP-like cAMP-binding protein
VVQKIAVSQKKIELVKDAPPVSLPSELQSHPILLGVNPRSLATIASALDLCRIPRSASLYRVETAASHVYLVVSGTVKTLHRSSRGETVESAWYEGFSILGVGELLGGSEAMQETAVAESAVCAYALPMELARNLVASDPRFLLNVAEALAARHAMGLSNERLTIEPAFFRVARYLITLSKRASKMVAADLYLVRTTQDDIAASTGLNPRTVSRAMKVLQKKGRLYIRRGEYLLREPMTLTAAFGDEAE